MWLAAAASLAISFHIQPNVSPAGGQLRLAASDVIASLLFVPFILFWLKNHTLIARGPMRAILLCWLVGSLVMTYGLVIGMKELDGITVWAATKYTGWFVLSYYALLGCTLWACAGVRGVWFFLLVFAAIHVLIVVLHVFGILSGTDIFGPSYVRLAGFMSNPNAYALTLVCAVALLERLRIIVPTGHAATALEILEGVLCAGILMSVSIAATCAMILVMLVSMISAGKLVSHLRIAAVAIAINAIPIAYSAMSSPPSGVDKPAGPEIGILKKLHNPEPGSSIVRKDSARLALDLWRERPWFGIGLGSFIAREWHHVPASGVRFQIHSTPLWLLTEMGVVGLAVFAFAFLLACSAFLSAVRAGAGKGGFAFEMAAAGLILMTAWAGMSLAHELMYQRVPWFVAGMCLAVAGFVRVGPPKET